MPLSRQKLASRRQGGRGDDGRYLPPPKPEARGSVTPSSLTGLPARETAGGDHKLPRTVPPRSRATLIAWAARCACLRGRGSAHTAGVRFPDTLFGRQVGRQTCTSRGAAGAHTGVLLSRIPQNRLAAASAARPRLSVARGKKCIGSGLQIVGRSAIWPAFVKTKNLIAEE